MPELPDVEAYREALLARVRGQRIVGVRFANPFVLRTAVPPVASIIGKTVHDIRRLGKRLVFVLDDDLFLVVHLMIAGRLAWQPETRRSPGRNTLAQVEFASGVLVLAEAGTKRRASLHVVAGEAALAEFDRGGLEVAGATLAQFRERLVRENHTVKNALTDPRLFSGIGNAYSDEILHRARLSPLALTRKLDAAAIEALHEATRDVLAEWTARLREEGGGAFPQKVTAFRPQMAVHGRFGQPCPVCGSPVQRIVYAENECNYCARCQTGGVVLADRALSRLLHDSWPRSLDDG